jgi:hypothetical protein
VARQKPKRQKRYRPRTVDIVMEDSGAVFETITDQRVVDFLLRQKDPDQFITDLLKAEIKNSPRRRPVDGDTQTRRQDNG